MRKIHENSRNYPVTGTVGYTGGKWQPIIPVLLMNGTMRFGDLTLFLSTISKKILTRQLREPEGDGFIIRQRYNEKTSVLSPYDRGKHVGAGAWQVNR